MSGTRALVFAGTVVAVVIGTAVGLNTIWSAPPDDGPVSLTEAEAVLDQAVRLARAGDVTGLCETVAATPGTCDFLLRSAADMHRTPGDTAPAVVGSSYLGEEGSPTLVLDLRGVTGENVPYHADFAVLRDGPEGLRSLTPVYWSGVRYGG